MSTADFQAVVAAIDAGPVPPPSEAPSLETVAVLGTGPLAHTLAASVLAAGASVRLWTPYASERALLLEAGGITVRGDDLAGTYATDPTAAIRIEVVDAIDVAVLGADAVFVAGSVTEQRSIGMMLAHIVGPGPMLIVVPGLTFGGIELRWWLRSISGAAQNTIVEIQDAPWSISATGPASVSLISRPPARMAAIPAGAGIGAADALGAVLPRLELQATVIHTSMSDMTGAVQVPRLIFGGSGLLPDSETLLPGAVPLGDPPVTPSASEPLALIVGGLATERRSVAQRWGVRDLPPDPAWIASVLDERAAQSLRGGSARGHILQRTAGSLVPLVSAAQVVDVDTPTTHAVINLVTTMFGFDLGASGRRLASLGLGRADLDGIRKAVGAGQGSD